MWSFPAIIAHRGGGFLAPENTLAAMRLAAAKHVAMVEFDVSLTRDRIPVLLHDETIDRTSNGHGRLDEMSFAMLSAFDFGGWFSADYAGEPLASLYSVAAFTIANNICSNIEIKPRHGQESLTGRLVARAASRYWAGHLPPLLSSFSTEALRAARDEAPQLPRALLLDGPPPRGWQTLLAQLKCMAVHLPHACVEPVLIRQIHNAGYALAAWTVNDRHRISELLEWGCNAVFTDELDNIVAL